MWRQNKVETMMPVSRIRILLVEDDMDLASGIGDYLTAHGLDVDFAYTAAQARARLAQADFDLFVFDVNLPGEDGITLCHELKQSHGLRQPAIFLTARDALEDKLKGFAAGAADYMIKPFAPAELLARILAITRYTGITDSLHVEAAGYRLDLTSGLLSRDDLHLQLHATGLAILRRLMQAYPRVVTHQALCEGLWGEDAPESDPLRVHIYHLRQALLAQFGEAPLGNVRGIGYRFGMPR